MQVKPDRLAGLLARPDLPAMFFIHGEEPLQRTECVDAVRRAVRAAGVDERLVFDSAVGIDWAQVQAEAGSLSLFASRRLIEINLGGKKPDRHGAAALKALAAQQGDDVFIVTAEALSRDDLNSEWCRALDGRGASVQCRALDPADFRQWLQARAAARVRGWLA